MDPLPSECRQRKVPNLAPGAEKDAKLPRFRACPRVLIPFIVRARLEHSEDQEGTGSPQGSLTNGQEEMAGEDDRKYSHQREIYRHLSLWRNRVCRVPFHQEKSP